MAQQVTQSDTVSLPTVPVAAIARRQIRITAVVLALLAVAVYLPAVGNDFVSWDDGHYVYENTHLAPFNWQLLTWALTDVSIVYWHPITWLSHALDVAIWGLNPFGHHLTNILLHGGNTFFVVLLAAKLLALVPRTDDRIPAAAYDRGGQGVVIGAGITGAMFALHPVHVESVAWVAERKDLLYTLFYLLGLLAYTDYIRTGAFRAVTWSFLRQRSYLFTLACFICSLASKPMAVTFPVIMMLLDWFPFYRDRQESKFQLLLEKLPFLMLGGVISVVTVMAQREVGAMVALGDIPFATRVLVVFQALLVYLRMIVWPTGLLPLYPYPERISLLMPLYAGATAAVSALTIACFLAAKRQRLWLAVWASFVIGLLPVIGLLQAGPQPWADRFIYLPSLGLFLLLALAATHIWYATPAEGKRRKLLLGIAGMLVVAMGTQTVSQIRLWQNSMHMWTQVINQVPHKLPFAYHNRAVLFTGQGDFDRAIDDASEAIDLAPEFHDAYHNRGNAFFGKGDNDRAIADFQKAATLKPYDPVIYGNLGLALAASGRFDEAIEAHSRALSLRPDFPDTWSSRGLAYLGKGDFAHALADFDRAGKINPGDVKVHVNRGIALAAHGEEAMAEREYAAALAQNPDAGVAANAHANRGVLLVKRKDYSGALDDFDRAVQLAPTSIAARNNRGALYRLRGDFRRAAEDFSAVLALNPSLAKTYVDRGEVYLLSGNIPGAKKDFETACSLGDRSGCSRLQSFR